jgi:hypothetical protein
MGPQKPRDSSGRKVAHSVKSVFPLPDPVESISDAIAVLETATKAIEASETQTDAAITLRVGIRQLLDAYAKLDEVHS